MSSFVLDDIRTDGSEIRYEYSVSGVLRRFFTDEAFFVDYDPDGATAAAIRRTHPAADGGIERPADGGLEPQDGPFDGGPAAAEDAAAVESPIDLSSVPEGILAVPLLANVCPIAWAADATVHVDVVDREFRDSMRAVRRSLAAMYPKLFDVEATATDAGIRAEEVIDHRTGGRHGDAAHRDGRRSDVRAGLLFSGGVDSLTSYLEHREHHPILIAVHGADIYTYEDEAWARTRRGIANFAREHREDVRFLRANMREFIDTAMLLAHYRRYLHDNWFCCVQHGVALLGQCAPLAYAEGIDPLYVAATHSEEFDQPWGSHPAIDDAVRWSGTTARHDGYDLTRQEKLHRIAEYVDETGDRVRIRSCYESAVGGNCDQCEKCARTQVGLVFAGLDPNEHGYDVRGRTFVRIRQRFDGGAWTLGPDERFMWTDLQRHADPNRSYPWPEAMDFARWLSQADIDALVEASGEPLRDRAIRAIGRNTPYGVYSRAYPVYRSVRSRLGDGRGE